MSRMNHVMQIGDIEGDIYYYIEDYAYTYLKKQKGKEKTKYFLYGEKEEKDNQQKLYIYGIAEKPKMEQTYFKEYYPLGFLKIKNEESYWITLKGQEEKISGFYVFYAPNQAMQEYLVDHREDEKQDKPEEQTKRRVKVEALPMEETLVSAGKIRRQKNHKEFNNEKFLFPVGGLVVAGLILLVLTSANGRKKIEIFKEVIAQTMSGMVEETSGYDLIIEEKSVGQENVEEDSLNQTNDNTKSKEENSSEANMDSLPKDESNLDEDISQEGQESLKESIENESVSNGREYGEEYVVKEGDTLAEICKTKYGSLTKIEEICTINNINNADYIAPGQKIYLP